MIFNVAQLLMAQVGTNRQYDLDDRLAELAEGMELVEPVRGNIRMTRTNRGVLVSARLDTKARLECSRCVESCVTPIHITFSEEYIPVVDVITGAPVHIPHESHDYLIRENHVLDLAPAVREYGLLALPMQPLCREDCPGLCPRCGKNLNEGSCRCSSTMNDERLHVLELLIPEDRG